MEQHINVNLRLLGWVLLVAGGVMIGVSHFAGLPEYGNGGLYVGMIGGILTMRAYMCAVLAASKEFHRENWQTTLDMGVLIAREQVREEQETRELRPIR